MKIAICSDIHMCQYSSIIRSQGTKYSTRLENCIKSISWFEQLAKKEKCDLEVYLGDTFDKSTLDDETITASKDIKWNAIEKYFLVGNHESSVNGLLYNSVKTLEGKKNHILNQPFKMIIDPNIELCFLPYITEMDRKQIKDYFDDNNTKRIIFSHNDVKGIQMGPIISKTGFEVEDIENSCDLFINGHLHNGVKFSNKGINLGILTGKDFGEDAFKYNHNIMILDTDTLEYRLIENPYAFNFYKIEINNEKDLDQLYNLKDNSILSIKCNEKYLITCNGIISDIIKKKIIEKRVTSYKELSNIEIDQVEEFSLDYINKFIEFCKEKIDNTEVLEKELSEVCK